MVQIKQYRHKNNLTDIVKKFLTHFISLFRFYNPLKKSENLRFFTFSGSIEMEYWAKMG